MERSNIGHGAPVELDLDRSIYVLAAAMESLDLFMRLGIMSWAVKRGKEERKLRLLRFKISRLQFGSFALQSGGRR